MEQEHVLVYIIKQVKTSQKNCFLRGFQDNNNFNYQKYCVRAKHVIKLTSFIVWVFKLFTWLTNTLTKPNAHLIYIIEN